MRVLLVLVVFRGSRGSFGSPWFSGSCGSFDSLVLVVGYLVALAARSPAKLICLDFLVNNFSTIQMYLVYNHTSVLPFQKVIIIEKYENHNSGIVEWQRFCLLALVKKIN